MGYFIGIDGGSSKTEFALYSDTGETIASCGLPGSSYRELGIEAVCAMLCEGVARVCEGAGRAGVTGAGRAGVTGAGRADVTGAGGAGATGAGRASVIGACYGMPCFGEHMEEDLEAAKKIERSLALPMRFENDVACAWAGALAFRSGIVMLAGTGAMAWGCDIHGSMHRCGGWSDFFSDEGSGYWLGRRMLELFSKQSDGRAARGPLHAIVRRHFSLQDDEGIIGIVEGQQTLSRKWVASLQRLLWEAADEGDAGAAGLYAEAAEELALMVKGLRGRMELPPGSPVSYAGGLFGAGEILLGPFRKALADTDMVFTKPALAPVDGALLFAVDRFAPGKLDAIRQTLTSRAS
ncbi:MAG: hypothetical protein FWG03_10040 [Clostridiales bacterium]|nr:hypothetical protein [Clostridiales bacterium]